MSKRACYFKCDYEGVLHNFPPKTYISYERYLKWKNILRKKDKDKSDQYIISSYKLCSNHFEKYYIVGNNRLTKHAVPTLTLGITVQQEELLCKFIEENSNLIMRKHINNQIKEAVKEKWKIIAPKLNTLGPDKNYDAWAEYLYEVMSNLKVKKVKWGKESGESESDEQVVINYNDFTDLEMKILQLWQKVTEHNSYNDFASEFTDDNVNMMEYVIEEEDCDYSGSNKDSENSSEIVRFTLNVATGGLKPLLQAADVAPYEAPQVKSTARCKCNNGEVQDEFDAFGKDIAEQLRNMPTQTAIETQELLMSVLLSKQTKIFHDSFLQD